MTLSENNIHKMLVGTKFKLFWAAYSTYTAYSAYSAKYPPCLTKTDVLAGGLIGTVCNYDDINPN